MCILQGMRIHKHFEVRVALHDILDMEPKVYLLMVHSHHHHIYIYIISISITTIDVLSHLLDLLDDVLDIHLEGGLKMLHISIIILPL